MFQEKDIEQFLIKPENYRKHIWGAFDDEEEKERTETLKIYNQVSIGNYGVIDILALSTGTDLGYDDKIVKQYHIDILEIKMTDKVSYQELGQLCRYMTAMENYLEEKKYPLSKYRIKEHLICRGLDKRTDFTFLLNCLDSNVYLYIFDITLEKGIKISSEATAGWIKTEEGEIVKNLDKIIPVCFSFKETKKKKGIIEEAKQIIKE